jgi:Holliday junction resolvase RusA-like endonuclease
VIFTVFVSMPPGDLAVNKRMTGDKGAVYRQARSILKRELREAARDERLPTPITGALRLTISHGKTGIWLSLETIEERDLDRTVDVDAPVKGILDAFQSARIIDDDCQIDELIVRRKILDPPARTH